MRWFQSVSQPQIRHWLERHLLFWIVATIAMWAIHSATIATVVEGVQTTLLMQPYHMLIAYVALYWVLPPVLIDRNRVFIRRLLIFLLGGWVLTFLYRAYVLVPFRTGKQGQFPSYHEIFTLGAWIISLMISGVAVGFKLYRFWYQREQANKRLTRETLAIELQVLKAQTHPHFLFNTLNNLYSLTLRQSPKAPDMILKLAGLLHYMIHECNAPSVLLVREIDFLRNYVELEKLRYGPRLVVSIAIHRDIDNKLIAPLLLIPFVENAFKHGSSKQIGLSHINLELNVTRNELTFKLDNSRDEQNTRTTKGLGLPNVRKRLALLYPNAYTLTIRPEIGRFSAELTIDLRNEPSRSKQSSSVLAATT